MNAKKLKRELGGRFEVVRNGKQLEILTKDGKRPVSFKADASWKDAGELAAYVKSRMPVAVINRR